MLLGRNLPMHLVRPVAPATVVEPIEVAEGLRSKKGRWRTRQLGFAPGTVMAIRLTEAPGRNATAGHTHGLAAFGSGEGPCFELVAGGNI